MTESDLIIETDPMGAAHARPEGVEHNVRNLSEQEIRFTEIELLG